MPRLTIECSPGFCGVMDCTNFLAFVHGKVASLGVFRPEALRSRLHVGEKWLIGSGENTKEAVHIVLQAKKTPRCDQGRSTERSLRGRARVSQGPAFRNRY